MECFFRPGGEETPVPGCFGHGIPGIDYCYNRFSDSILRLRRPRCTSNNPCSVCVGDCNFDNDCEGNLKCFHGTSRQDMTATPGCLHVVVPGLDYCYDPETEKEGEQVRCFCHAYSK